MEVNNISPALDSIARSEVIGKQSKISKFRNYASQIYATFATNLVKCMVGSNIGFTSVLVAQLYKENAEIKMSVSDLTWFSAHCFMIPVGALLLATMAERIGSRRTMLIASVFYAFSSVLFYFAESSEMLLSAQAIAGLFFTISIGPGITYVIEITQSPLRSALTASTTFSSMCAVFLVVFLSNFFHWRTLALIILIFPITGFIAVYSITETPHWLASKKRFDEAEAALCWLRGWTSPENVNSEFNKLKETYTSSRRSSQNNFDQSRLSVTKKTIGFYLHRSFYIPLVSMGSLFILHNFTGGNQLSIYSIVIYGEINVPLDPHVAASIFDVMRIMGAIICILLIHNTGKKKLVYFSLIGAALTLLTTSASLLMKNYQIHSEICQWVAAISMMLTTFSMSAGIDKIIIILNAEIFATKYRSVGTGAGLFVNYTAQAICNKLFLYLMEAVTLSGVFCIFGVMCLITCAMFHFTFPETEGKSLQDIEDYYNSNTKL